MANPQLHNGHTRIANEILNEIMKLNLNGTQFRIVLAIWRNTYGYQRKSHEMSTTYLAKEIDANRSQADRELKALVEQNIITVNGIGKKGARILSFQKNYKRWGKAREDLEIKKMIADTKKMNAERAEKAESNKKDKYDVENTYFKMAKYFHERISIVAKDAGVEHLIAKANLQRYADDFRKIVELDGANKKQVKEVIDYATTDDFWKTNILSADKLRKQFLQLSIRMNAQTQPSQPRKMFDGRDKEIELQKWMQAGNDPNDFKWN